ncbi:DUF4303 domain-containing protein [Pseudomonas sp. KNUC1026]|uniref:DUF4303 domain-containing protein n=1 Tax=Pseudomonas sp. KNUC1026 TaxID=2893890 RepID=UPI001F1711CC|nr:DUF4303 domain-containing protein [Pseudomonas sp. KNUC1026]UFH50451.1 DUF4303 domain-containing protein [Pseudomonas sp. KNUC1026]
MDWIEFADNVFIAAKETFLEIQKKHEAEVFYAFALYTDSSAMSLGCSANSLQALEQKLRHEDYEGAAAEDLAYIKWSSSEWAYEGIGAERFAEACRQLRATSEPGDVDSLCEKLEAVLAQVLSRLNDEGVFKSNRQAAKPVIFVTVTDDDDAERMENETAAKLNEGAALFEFLNRYET